jgi:predicted ferric reductase
VSDAAVIERDVSAPDAARLRRALAATVLLAIFVGNVVALGWLWWHGGNVTTVHTTGEALTSVARITGLEGAFLALVEVVLLARLPVLERLVGLDRLSIWHRWNGHICIDLVIAHVIFSVWGYSLLDGVGLGKEIDQMIGGGIYPGMITATVGTALLIAVAASSYVFARRRLPYEWWYAVHLTAYAAIALSWFHEIPTGNELVQDRTAADYWRVLYVVTLVVLVLFRVVAPIVAALRFDLRVVDVTPEGAGVVSVRVGGRNLDKLRAQPGQFFLWRFLDRRRWWKAHPFSLSAAPDGRTLRITVKALGDDTSRIDGLQPGTRVLVEGPFGVFTESMRRSEKVLLIGGGIGITPIRALLETMRGDLVVVYRVLDDDDVIFRDELESLRRDRGATLHVVVGDHRGDGHDLLSPSHLRELVPDLAEREVYLCGPPAMTAAIGRNLRDADVERRRVHVERFALT